MNNLCLMYRLTASVLYVGFLLITMLVSLLTKFRPGSNPFSGWNLLKYLWTWVAWFNHSGDGTISPW
jgi:hypothetical protein